MRPFCFCCFSVGASLLAKNSKATRFSRMHALSLTFFASRLAPTVSAEDLRFAWLIHDTV
ncbi:hypothetical protein EI969_17825 [Pseudomonas sp. PB101]|nr:hypothetical protein [Pseudomonas sp. PB101]